MMSLETADRLVTPEVLERYRRDGCWVSPPLFDAADVRRLVQAHERLWAGEHDRPIPPQYGLCTVDPASSRLRQQCNAFWVNDAIRWAVTHPVIGLIAARLMDAAQVRLWHDQAIHKPPVAPGEKADGNNVGWHQDYGYWQASSTSNMCTAWIALQDTDLRNGGMRTLLGSHRWGTLADKLDLSFWDQDLGRVRERFGAVIDEPCIIPAGAASFHHALTFHGSGPNHSEAPRRSLVAHMMPGGTRYRAGVQWHPNLVFLGPDAREGDPFEGPWWPLMWPPQEGRP
jgi:ectoine hydroxylase-related dioxygenase (phytanoyl-CoA dioxygenase family)